jgi:hypothetical protein
MDCTTGRRQQRAARGRLSKAQALGWLSTEPKAIIPTSKLAQPVPDLDPTGDPEEDLTQLVCLVEAVQPDNADEAANIAGFADVLEFARRLRQSWGDDS